MSNVHKLVPTQYIHPFSAACLVILCAFLKSKQSTLWWIDFSIYQTCIDSVLNYIWVWFFFRKCNRLHLSTISYSKRYQFLLRKFLCTQEGIDSFSSTFNLECTQKSVLKYWFYTSLVFITLRTSSMYQAYQLKLGFFKKCVSAVPKIVKSLNLLCASGLHVKNWKQTNSTI